MATLDEANESGTDTTSLDRRLEAVLEEREKRRGSSGSSGGMDDWQHSVENRLTGLERQVLDLREEVRGLRADVRADIEELRGELSKEIKDARGDIRADVREVKVEMRWMVSILIAGLLGLLGAMARASAGSDGVAATQIFFESAKRAA